ncbi:MAG: glycosyltransferase family 4 protein [bacterium]|jgi:glycosyltransferase involved in cell wall biosynthesis|nr:glycosyltransferase family 4 protein [bacterium]
MYDARIYERTCRALVRIGHRVTLIITHDKAETLNGVEILPIPERRGLRRRILSCWDALRLARRVKADVYHFHDPDLLPWMVLLAWQGRPVIYDKHENHVVRFHMWGLPGWMARLAGGMYTAIECWCIAQFAGVVAVSDSILAMSDGVRRDGVLVQNVPDIKRLVDVEVPEVKPLPPTVYTSGTHSDDRHCRQTIQAMPEVLAKHPDTVFAFVGRYEPAGYDQVLRELARHLSVEQNLCLEGMLPWKDNFMRLMNAHIGCVFYEDNVNNRVTIPNRIFEYMFCGVAVLAQDFPELVKILNDTQAGLVVDTSRPGDIAQAIITLLDDPSRRQAMGTRGRQTVLETYNLNRQVLNLLQLYNRVLRASQMQNTMRDEMNHGSRL